MAEELHDNIESVSGGELTHSRTAIYYNDNEIPIHMPCEPCFQCGSRNFGLRKAN